MLLCFVRGWRPSLNRILRLLNMRINFLRFTKVLLFVALVIWLWWIYYNMNFFWLVHHYASIANIGNTEMWILVPALWSFRCVLIRAIKLLYFLGINFELFGWALMKEDLVLILRLLLLIRPHFVNWIENWHIMHVELLVVFRMSNRLRQLLLRWLWWTELQHRIEIKKALLHFFLERQP